MGQSARKHAEDFLSEARAKVERSIADGDVPESEHEIMRLRGRVDALEYLEARLAGDVDRLEANEAARCRDS